MILGKKSRGNEVGVSICLPEFGFKTSFFQYKVPTKSQQSHHLVSPTRQSSTPATGAHEDNRQCTIQITVLPSQSYTGTRLFFHILDLSPGNINEHDEIQAQGPWKHINGSFWLSRSTLHTRGVSIHSDVSHKVIEDFAITHSKFICLFGGSSLTSNRFRWGKEVCRTMGDGKDPSTTTRMNESWYGSVPRQRLMGRSSIAVRGRLIPLSNHGREFDLYQQYPNFARSTVYVE